MRGVEVTIFTLHYPFTRKTYKWKGCNVIPLNGANSRIKRFFLLSPMLKRAFRKQHSNYPIDLIHTFWLNEATLFGYSLSTDFSIPLLATAMGQDVLDSNSYKKNVLSKKIPMVALSRFHAGFLKLSMKEVIPFGVKAEGITETEKTCDLIFVGSLIKLKNPLYFLQLCNHLGRLDLKINIVGTGPEDEKCRSYIEKNELRNVQLLGECSYAQTQAHLASSRVLVHCSSFESFGMVFIEAMAEGVHVFAPPVGFAYQHPTVHTLTFDLEKDVDSVIQLLELPAPSPVVYSIETTVDAYLQRYNSLLI